MLDHFLRIPHKCNMNYNSWLKRPAWQLTTSALPVHIAALLQRGTDTDTNCRWVPASSLWQQHTATSTPSLFLCVFASLLYVNVFNIPQTFSHLILFPPVCSSFPPCRHHRWVLNIPTVALHMLLSHPSVGLVLYTCPEIPEKNMKFLSTNHTKFSAEQGMRWQPCSSLTSQGERSSWVLRLESSFGSGDFASAQLWSQSTVCWEGTIFHITEPTHWK